MLLSDQTTSYQESNEQHNSKQNVAVAQNQGKRVKTLLH